MTGNEWRGGTGLVRDGPDGDGWGSGGGEGMTGAESWRISRHASTYHSRLLLYRLLLNLGLVSPQKIRPKSNLYVRMRVCAFLLATQCRECSRSAGD